MSDDDETIDMATHMKKLNANSKKLDIKDIPESPYMKSAAAHAALQQILAEHCTGRVVVLSGCGGGCDVFGTMYLYQQVKKVARKVVLANLGFTSTFCLVSSKSKCILPPSKLFCVPPGVDPELLENNYFPEALLANAVKQPVYCFPVMSVQEIADCHKAILRAEGVQNPTEEEAVLFLCDGGCDVLLTGKETGLATPVEDMLHLRATQLVGYKKCFVGALGPDVDCGHGVVFSEMVKRFDDLKASGAILFAKIMTLADEDAKFFVETVSKCDPVNTIVQSLASAAIEGNRGAYTPEHLVKRIGRSRVPLTDFTASFFLLDYDIVAKEILYLPGLLPESSSRHMQEVLFKFRRSIGRPM